MSLLVAKTLTDHQISIAGVMFDDPTTQYDHTSVDRVNSLGVDQSDI